MAPVQELAGLSSILSRIAAQQGEREGEVNRQAGFTEAENAPQDVIDELAAAHRDQDTVEGRQAASKAAIARAVKDGKIHVSEDPWVHVGFVQGAANRLMQGYDAKLAARMSEATATQDANGDPVMAKDPGAVIQEVWGEYKDNPILQNYYGSKVAQQVKVDADARFTSDALRKLGENRVNDTIQGGVQNLADKFVAMQVSGQDPDDATWQNVRDWSKELHDSTGGKADVRKVMLASLKGATATIEGKDDGMLGFSQAAEFLRKLRSAPVGSTTAGKDAEVAPELEQMILDAERLHKSKVADREAQAGSADRLALADGTRRYLQFKDERRNLGEDALSSYAAWEQKERTDGTLGDRMGLVFDHVQRIALASEENQGAVEAGNLQKQLDQGVDPDAVADQLAALAGSISHDSYLAVDAAIEQRRSLRPLIENSPIAQARKDEVVKASVVPGIPEGLRDEIGTSVRDQNSALYSDYQKREQAAAAEWAKLPKSQQDAAQRAWYDENVPAVTKAMQENGKKFTEDQNAAVAEINQLIAQHQNPEKVLLAKRDLLGAKQVEYYRAKAVEATNYEGMTNTAAFAKGSRLLEMILQNKYKDDPDRDVLVESGLRSLHDQFVSTVSEKLAAADPSKTDAVIYQTTRELEDAVLQEVESQKLLRFGEALETGGETLDEAKQLVDFGAADRQAAKAAQQDPEQAAKILITSTPSPNVSEDLLELQQGLVGGGNLGLAGAFGRVREAHVLDRAYGETVTALNNPRLDPVAKAQAAVDARRGTYIPAEEVLAGKMTVAPSSEWRERVDRYVRRYGPSPTALVAADSLSTRLSVDLIQKAVSQPPTQVSLKGVKIGPYTTPFFRSGEELRQWADERPEDLKRIARTYGVLEDDASIKEFIRFQEAAIRRLNQE